jgi:hypothetical protein
MCFVIKYNGMGVERGDIGCHLSYGWQIETSRQKYYDKSIICKICHEGVMLTSLLSMCAVYG